jgi:hypothetical protein
MPDLLSAVSKPARGRPKEELVEAFSTGLMMSQRKGKETLCANTYYSLIGPEIFDQLPRKVLIELGRHIWADPELFNKVTDIPNFSTEEEKEGSRLAIFAEYPWLLENYNHALSLKKSNWSADAIVTALRQERLANTGTRARSTWDERYQAAVNSISMMVQRRAAELIEPDGDLSDMVRRLLTAAYPSKD